MSLLIGILFFGLGLIAFWAWLPYTLHFLQGLLACTLILSGFLTIIVGLASQRAKTQLKAAKTDSVSQHETAITPPNPEN